MPGLVCAQVPTGAITGFVTDGSGARLPGASVIITNKEYGFEARTLVTSDMGDLQVPPVLFPGLYQVAAE